MRTLLYTLLLMIPFCASAQEKKDMESPMIYISFDKVKHIVLPAQVSDISSTREDLIKAERVDAAPNIVCITAQSESFNQMTNLVIVCIDGSVHSYRIAYLPEGLQDDGDNIVYASGTEIRSHHYRVVANIDNTTEMFFPTDIVYTRQGNEEVFGVEYYNNMIKVNTTFEKFQPSNLFVVDKNFNTYEITIVNDHSLTYTYNIDDGRTYVAHIDANSIEMEKLIDKLRMKKRNIYSVGVIKNKFEMSLATLYVYEDFLFFAFDIRNLSNIDYDIDFVKCFLRDQKKLKNAIQQEVQYDPVQQKDFTKKILGKSSNRFVLAFNKFTIPDDKIFEIEMFEKGGGRHMKLTILNEYILAAQLLK